MTTMKPISRSHGACRLGAMALGATVALAGCEVKNPGAILDKDLNDELVMAALVTGMSADFSEEYDGVAFLIARASDEMTGSGSYFDTGLLRRGLVEREDVNGEWGGLQRARWVAEAGLERMKTVMGADFDGNLLTARAYLLAGLSNRALGECMCEAVFDGSPAGPSTEYFTRAIGHFNEAMTNAQMAGGSAAADIITAARGGLAQAYVGLGDWTNAAANATPAMVPTDFVHSAVYSDNSGREENVIYNETWGRPEMSAFGTYAGSFSPPDPRAPWKDCTLGGCKTQKGADGVTAHWRQQKYDQLGSDIPVVKGTEMRLIEAEKLIRVDNDIPAAMVKINEVRNFHGITTDLTAADFNEAMTHLDRERYLTLWLEGRRFFDARRWDEAGYSFLPSVMHVYGLTSAVYGKDPRIAKRATCIPIGQEECQTNANLSCQ